MNLPPGVRFSPTEDELITYYLQKKINGEPFPPNFIIERELYGMSPWKLFDYDSDPWQITKVRNKAGSVVGTNQAIYVITKLKKASLCRKSRVAGCGVWHGEGGPYNIHNNNGVIIGTEKTYSFQVTDGSEDGIPKVGHWIMHELSSCMINSGTETNNNYVICKISRDDSKPLKKNIKKRAKPSTASLEEKEEEDNSSIELHQQQRTELKMNNEIELAAELQTTEENNKDQNVASNEDEDGKYFAANLDAELESVGENSNDDAFEAWLRKDEDWDFCDDFWSILRLDLWTPSS